MDLTPDLQCSVDANVSFSRTAGRICGALNKYVLLHVQVTTCYYQLMIPEGVEARSQCPSAAAWRGHPGIPSGCDWRADREVGG